MAPTDPALAASVRAYLDRDWARFERVRLQAHAAARQYGGIAESLRVVEQLRASARALRPAWPTEADREADLEHHRQVTALLARTAPRAAEAASTAQAASIARATSTARRRRARR